MSPAALGRRRSGARGLATAASLLVAALLGSTARAQPRPETPAAVAERPFDAPLLASIPQQPPLPPEYLTQDRAGIHFAYHPSARDRVRRLMEDAEAVRQALRGQLGQPVLASVEVRVAMSRADALRITPELGSEVLDAVESGPRGLALSQLGLLVLRLDAPAEGPDVEVVFRRGMAHLALDEAIGEAELPRWFREGFATQFSGEARIGRANELFWAALQQRLVPMADLDWLLPRPASVDSVAAAQAADFVQYLVSAESQQFHHLVAELREGAPLSVAIATAYAGTDAQVELAWRRDVARRRVFVTVLAGAIGLWILGVLVHVAHRRLRTRRARRSGAEARARLPRLRVLNLGSDRSDGERKPPRKPPLAVPEPIEPEVPKVSHDGQWHTLH